jgi:hypothetical protein
MPQDVFFLLDWHLHEGVGDAMGKRDKEARR